MEFSNFGTRFTRETGIGRLMEDLGEAMAGDQEVLMLGGGNPAYIPEILSLVQSRMQQLADEPVAFRQVIGNYDAPRGDSVFIQALTDFFRQEYGWDIGPDNVVLTSGSQQGFFMLFNLFAGQFSDGSKKQILLPLVPEYIGYSDVGLEEDLFISQCPEIETFADHTFKYHVAFNNLILDDSIGAICVSRPTNPTGNVISDASINHLLDIATRSRVPLIIDNAYGMPFPNIIFTAAELIWTEQVVLCLSLSKFGLPGVRTGIIIASEKITEAIARMNSIINLALGSIGPALFTNLVTSRKAVSISREIIMPYYQGKAGKAIEMLHRELAGIDYYIHKSEGAIFLWLWFPGLPVTNEELYLRLKQRGVLIISGHHFFPGLRQDWRHRHECIRISYAMDEAVVRQGISIIADEIKKITAQQGR